MRCAVKCCVFIEIYGEFETFSTSSAPSGHLLLKEKALVCANLKQSDKSEFPYMHKPSESMDSEGFLVPNAVFDLESLQLIQKGLA